MKPLAILFAATLVHGASVTGRVFDPSGAAIPGAQVRLGASSGPGQWQTASQEDGRYEFSQVPPGTYEIQVLVPGFAALRRNAVIRADSDRLEVNPILRLGEIQETIRVNAQGRPATPGRQRIRVGGNIQPARLIQQTKPEYPDSARRAGKEGTAIFRALISKDGAVTDLTPMTGCDAELSAAAAAAIRQWRYQPALLNGAPVEIVTVVETAFRLTE